MVMCQVGPKIRLNREQCPRQASCLSPSLSAGRGPPGAVDRNSSCSEEPARLAWAPGLCSCAPGPALLPAGMESVGQSWGLSWGFWKPSSQSYCRDSLTCLSELCAGFLVGGHAT